MKDKIPSPHSSRLVEGELTLIGGLNDKLFRLLTAIKNTGSISKAARDVGLSYKGAWEIIDRANNLSAELLVDTAVGGRSGGGTRLTPAGQELIDTYFKIQVKHNVFLDQINQQLLSNPNLLFLQNRLRLKLSTRNQLFGKVKKISNDPFHAMVLISLKGGMELTASLTVGSLENLGITEGAGVLALIDTPNIMVVRDGEKFHYSGKNQLPGTVERIRKGSINSEVVMRLDGGNSLAASVTNESLTKMQLQPEDRVVAIFKAGAVILATAQNKIPA